jgi:chaperone required for assembly of F1-ATPase
MKRFYKDVQIRRLREGDEWGVMLDARPVRTPARALLTLPNPQLANAVAEEWRAQGEEIDPRSMPLTGLANAAIDHVTPDPAAFAAPLARYAETDLLCYRADDPPALVARQAAAWDPLLAWARQRYDVGFVIATGIVHKPQPAATLERMVQALTGLSPFALAALAPLVTISGSLIVALAVIEGQIAPDAAFDTAHLDELWQAEQWGEDWMAEEQRAAHRADFTAAARFLALLAQPASA